MSQISVLDQNTINKIAAGEVIERPAAVVKELVENAIDAGANAITIEIKEGGIRFIRVTDNGSGIQNDDVRTAFLPHATSKIKTIEDLFSVSSLGFRGEALPSIASVSQVELITKSSAQLMGIRYTIEGGEEKTFEEVGCPEGTTFIIRNLFYNTPARHKFLKSATSEAGFISDLIERFAISHPNVSFKFLNNNQLKLHTTGNNNLKDIIYHVYGREIAANLLSVNQENEQFALEGFIGKPLISRGNRNYENYFINGRYIKSSIISKAIEEAYRPYSMTHRYPFTAIHFTIPGDMIDVNVHPTKMEIRFHDNEFIYRQTFHFLRDILKGKELIPDISLDNTNKINNKSLVKQERQSAPEPFENIRREAIKRETVSIEVPLNEMLQSQNDNSSHDNSSHDNSENHNSKTDNSETGNSETGNKELMIMDEQTNKPSIRPNVTPLVKESGSYHSNLDQLTEDEIRQPISQDTTAVPPQNNVLIKDNTVQQPQTTAEQLHLFEHNLLSKEAQKEHRIIGQLFSTYWLIEYKDKLFMIDQHAAHEKVLYESYMQVLKDKTYQSQMIHPPILLTLNMKEEQVLSSHLQTLTNMGFEIEHFGGREYCVRAVPNDLLGIAQTDILIELIDSLVEEVHSDIPAILIEKTASLACKAAVKGNQHLSFEEAGALIDKLLTLENPYHCPHGRPVIIAMSKYEIEKKFKRIL